MTNDDDKPKVVDLQIFKRKSRAKVDDQTMERVWQALVDLWVGYAEAVNSRRVAGELCLSGEPSAVFSVLAERLVSLAQAQKIENNEILDTLLGLALIECEPKGRLFQLLNKASNLLDYGDEDAWEKMLREQHAAGELTDEQLADELKIPQ